MAAATPDYRQEGNAAFRAGESLKAAAAYTKGLAATEDPAEKATLLSNRSAALLKLGKANKALADADACIAIDASVAKAHWRRGLALEALGKLQDAVESMEAATKLGGGDQAMSKKLHEVQKALARQKKV